jgi:glycosyltransferase involved in cell wall biosynthesis
MLWHTLRLGRRPEVVAFTSINPIPYGLVQLPAAKLLGKPLHFGFVGSDWYRHVMGRSGRWLRPLLRQADFVTATGPKMRRQMIEYGIPEDRIAILPHAIDVENYPVNDPPSAKYAAVFVGALIERKRVDVLLRAFAQVLMRRPEERFCIVGDGPLAGQLKQLAADLAIDHAVEFAGFQRQVQPYLSQSRLLVMASSMEGLPFAVIEAMCSGVVPVCTAVGTIEDLLVSGENGLLYEQGDWRALADYICALLEDEAIYLRLRAQALGAREAYSFDAATAVWDAWFKQIG